MSNNSFLRKATPEDSDRQTAVGGFHKSLWNCFRKGGFDASSSGTTAWLLIRAARPSMPHHASSLAKLQVATRAELGELRAAVSAAMRSDSTKKSPARTDLAGDILRVIVDACAVADRREKGGHDLSPEDRVVRRTDENDAELELRKRYAREDAAPATRVAESAWPTSERAPVTSPGVAPPAPGSRAPMLSVVREIEDDVDPEEQERRGALVLAWRAEGKKYGLTGDAFQVFVDALGRASGEAWYECAGAE